MKTKISLKNKYLIILVGIAVLSIVLAAVVVLTGIIKDSLYAERKHALTEVVYASAKTIDENINSEWKMQDLFSGIVSNHLDEYGSVENFIANAGESLNIDDDLFFLVDKNGKYYSSDGKDGVIPDISLYTNDAEDEVEYLSTLPHMNQNESYLILRSRLPETVKSVFNGKEVEIAYCATLHDLYHLNETVSTLFNGSNNTFIYERDNGNMLYKQFGLSLLIEGYNIYQKFYAVELPYSENAEELVNNCKNGETFVVNIRIKGQDYYAASTPLNIDNWGLFYIVSEEYVEEASAKGIETIIFAITATVSTLGLLLLFLTYIAFRSREKEKEESIRKANEVIEYFTNKYSTVLLVDNAKDTCRVLKNTAEEYYRDMDDFTEQIKWIIYKNVYHLDREKLYEFFSPDNVAYRLKRGENLSAEYRKYNNNNNNNLTWESVQITKTEDENTYLIGFSNIDDQILLRYMTSIVFDDYFAVYEVNLDVNFIKEIKNENSYYPSQTATNRYSDVINEYASKLDGEYRIFWQEISEIESFIAYLGDNEKREYIFEIPSDEGKKWNKCTFYVTEATDRPVTVVMAFSYLDIDQLDRIEMSEILEKQKLKLEQDLNVINILASEYSSVYYIELDSGKIIPYSMNEEAEHSFGEIFNSDIVYEKALMSYVSKFVFEQDRQKVLQTGSVDNIRTQLSNTKSFTSIFRGITGDKLHYCEMKFVKLEESDIQASVVGLGFADRDEEIVERLISNRINEQFNAIYLVNIPEDIIRPIHLSQDGYLKYYSKEGSYNEAILLLARQVTPDYIEAIEKLSDTDYLITEYLKDEDKREMPVRLQMTDGREQWLKITYYVLERDNEIPSSVAVATSYMDSGETEKNRLFETIQKQKIKLEENINTIGGLANEYDALIRADLRSDTYEMYNVTDEKNSKLARMSGDKFTNAIKGFSSMFVHPEDVHEFEKYTKTESIREILKDKKSDRFVFRANFSGQWKWYEQTIIKEEKENETANVIIIGFVDRDDEIKEEQQRQKELENALSMAQSANRAKTVFLNNMSHDIRTPMNAVIGFNNIAKKNTSDPKVKRYLDKVGQASEHLLSLINDVLDMSRIESGKVSIQAKDENLKEIVDNLNSIVSPGMAEKHLEFRVECENIENENIVCDRLRLNQVLLNILSNAQKYTEHGYVEFKVKQIPSDIEGYANYQFIVKDSGVGMSKEFVNTLFEPFTREKTATISGIEGTGLGMSITKNIIDMMGGTIEVNTEVGMGSEFIYTQKFKISEQTGDVKGLEEFNGKQVMIAEHDAESALNISNIFTSLGLLPEFFTDSTEIKEELSKAKSGDKQYDLYLLDFEIPGFDAVLAGQAIRENNADAKIVIMTSDDYGEIEKKAYDAGVNMCLSKPLFPSSTADMLQKLYGKTEKKAEGTSLPEFTGTKILLVEDNEMNREIATEILEEVGIAVTTAADGLDAVNMVKASSPGDFDVILMDIQMPVMDGYEATRQIRSIEDSSLSSIPIIAMTANAFEEDRKAAFAAGMNEHLAKPIDIKKLYSALSKALKD